MKFVEQQWAILKEYLKAEEHVVRIQTMQNTEKILIEKDGNLYEWRLNKLANAPISFQQVEVC